VPSGGRAVQEKGGAISSSQVALKETALVRATWRLAGTHVAPSRNTGGAYRSGNLTQRLALIYRLGKQSAIIGRVTLAG
jgi:hypothetical protein